jgi:hypothetical protein
MHDSETLMKTRLFISMLSFVFLTFAQVAKAQDVSDWIPQPVRPKDEASAKTAKTNRLGKATVKVRSSAVGLDSESPKPLDHRCAGAQMLTTNARTPNTPMPNDFIIGACCDCSRILLDGLMFYQNATLNLFNSTPNSTVPVTLGHSGPGRIGFSLNVEGPYVDSLVFNINTNSSGNGSVVIGFHIKGLDVGQSNMTTTVASGSTNPVPQMEVFACQCPPVPNQ